MFGVSFSEILLIAVVALIVVGPQKLPRMLGTLGNWIARLRAISSEMRRQTGIDDILREEGIQGGLTELRHMVRGDIAGLGLAGGAAAARGEALDDPYEGMPFDRSREYPTEGPDAYGAIPEDLFDDEEDEALADAEALAWAGADASAEQGADDANRDPDAPAPTPDAAAPGNVEERS